MANRDTLTAEEAAILAEAEAKRAELQRYKDDVVVSLAPHGDRVYALTKMGRVFCRMADPRNFNTDGRGTMKYLWNVVEGPF